MTRAYVEPHDERPIIGHSARCRFHDAAQRTSYPQRPDPKCPRCAYRIANDEWPLTPLQPDGGRPTRVGPR
jgi:hypothetical protein